DGAEASSMRFGRNDDQGLDLYPFNMLDGRLPARVRGLVEEWMELHQEELLSMWVSKEFHKVAPLV
ncbi:MAG: DUF4160 domain-containing protein, partial [Magnetococcales bacterium]|nr:DUF4160 domain-containing protein [Magnetococcales bacterium]